MPIFKFKDNVPSVYVEESRDFQLFLKVLDFIQNGVKYDIDSMLNITSTPDISSEYLERLKSKVGFFTDKIYDEDKLRLALQIFPLIIRYKGSIRAIKWCVDAFLNHIGITDGSLITVQNEPDFLVRIGIKSKGMKDKSLLEDLLSFILPAGYLIEVYFYEDFKVRSISSIFNADNIVILNPTEEQNTSIRADLTLEGYEGLKNRTYSTVQLGMVYDPNNKEEN